MLRVSLLNKADICSILNQISDIWGVLLLKNFNKIQLTVMKFVLLLNTAISIISVIKR